jgi:hypothetical protein
MVRAEGERRKEERKERTHSIRIQPNPATTRQPTPSFTRSLRNLTRLTHTPYSYPSILPNPQPLHKLPKHNLLRQPNINQLLILLPRTFPILPRVTKIFSQGKELSFESVSFVDYGDETREDLSWVGLDGGEERRRAADLRELEVEMGLGRVEAEGGTGKWDGWRDGWEGVHFWEGVSRGHGMG